MTKKKTLKEGDVVYLKSGGPQMVIEAKESFPDKSVTVECVWFNDHGLVDRGSFEEETLALGAVVAPQCK